MKKFLWLTLILVNLCFLKNVKAAEYQQELRQLREDIQVLQRQMYRSNESSQKTVSSENSTIQGKIGEYDETIRKLNGRLDELENAIKQNESKLDKINRDMEIRFKILEGRQVPANLSAPAPKIAQVYDAPVANNAASVVIGERIQGGDLAPLDEGLPQQIVSDIAGETSKIPVETVNANNPNDMYNNSMAAYNSGLYDEAELGFEDIIKQFPKHNLASSAQYWLGEVYLKQGNLDKAKTAFKDGYEKYKNGNKAADSLFRLGTTLNKAGNKDKACIVYMSFDAEFPKAPTDLKNKVQAEAKKLGCK